MTYKIKLRIDFCDAVLDGRKTFEIRENDRDKLHEVSGLITPVILADFKCLSAVQYGIAEINPQFDFVRHSA